MPYVDNNGERVVTIDEIHDIINSLIDEYSIPELTALYRFREEIEELFAPKLPS